MTQDQALVLGLLGLMVGALLWGRFRHDVVALAALLAAVLAGLVPAEAAFAGFGHPAVITVACVLVLSQALQHTGAVDWLARAALPAQAGRTASLAALMGLGAGLSAFMNNVGAMALLMPVAVQTAARLGLPPGRVLMPLAFGTILGGMTTLVGTPPNLIVAGFRPGEPFRMFDFAWVGLPVALAGILLVLLGGWRLVPDRRPPATEGFVTGSYLTELAVTEGARALGWTLRAVEDALDPAEGRIVALVRDGQRRDAPSRRIELRANDVLLVEAEAEGLAEALAATGLTLHADRAAPPEGHEDAGEIALAEYAILPGSALAGRTARDLRLRRREGLSLLAVSRSGRRPQARLRTLALKPGDVILLQGPPEALADFAAGHGLAPLAPRALRLPHRGRALMAGGAMAGAVGLAAAGAVPAAVAFALGVLAVMALRLLPLRQVYAAIDWPVVVLLAALIPVAGAMETTGAAQHLAEGLVGGLAPGAPLLALALVLVVTMVLSDVMNNAATAAVMAPVALAIAQALGVSADPLLMAVAIGASCAFLTPIGHQNNTLILGPGGFGFGDYWRLGLPLEVVVVAVAVPLLPLVFPF